MNAKRAYQILQEMGIPDKFRMDIEDWDDGIQVSLELRMLSSDQKVSKIHGQKLFIHQDAETFKGGIETYLKHRYCYMLKLMGLLFIQIAEDLKRRII